MTKINLGCGENKKHGYLNIDYRKEAEPDVLMTIGKDRFPFDDNSIDEIFAHNSLEHFDNFLFVVQEMGRVSKNGCIWKITLPYATSTLFNLINPYHLNPFFTENTFRFWDDIYKREQTDNFNLRITKTDFVYNESLWGKHTQQEWEKLRNKYLNVVTSFYQEITCIKPKKQ